jgi:hypothetical protein
MNNDKLLKEIRKNQILAGMIIESEDTTQVPDFDITGSAVKESAGEVPLAVTEFRFKVKHDNGVKKLKTKASSLEAAKQIIMKAEGCPEGALELVSEAVIKENLEPNGLTPDKIANECLMYLMTGSFDFLNKRIIDEGHEWSKHNVYNRHGKPSKRMYDTLDIAITLGIETEENNTYDVDFIFKAVIYSKGSPETNRSMDPQNDTGSDPEYNTELKGIIIKDKDNKVVWGKNIEPDKNPLISRDLSGFENFFKKDNFDFDKELDGVVESYIIDGSDGFREPEDMSGYRSSDVEAKEFGGMDI